MRLWPVGEKWCVSSLLCPDGWREEIVGLDEGTYAYGGLVGLEFLDVEVLDEVYGRCSERRMRQIEFK